VWDAAPSPGGAGEREDPDALAAGYSNPAFYSAEHSDTAFLVGKTLECVETVAGRQPWALHLSLLRPHPPWLAPEPYNRMYHPDELEPPQRSPEGVEAERATHPYLDMAISSRQPDEQAERRGKAVYYGLCSEVDSQLGRLFERLKEIGEYEKTLIIFTADHGEQLGDHYMSGEQKTKTELQVVCCNAVIVVPKPMWSFAKTGSGQNTTDEKPTKTTASLRFVLPQASRAFSSRPTTSR
jgi:arylsulfatase A-like enzyme